MQRSIALLALAGSLLCLMARAGGLAARAGRPSSENEVLYVDPAHGADDAAGTRAKPLRSLSAALARIGEPVEREWRVELASGTYDSTGGVAMPANSLRLEKRMRLGGSIRLAATGAPAIFAWKGERRTIEASDGHWLLSGIQVGTFEEGQVRGLYAHGAVDVAVREASFELRSASDAALWAERGARIALGGAIRVNARVLDKEKPEQSYSGIVATDGGIVEFEDGASASLVLGNGSLRASYYGTIRLGCRTAELTSRTRSNVLSIGNSGRIDLRNTATILIATDPANTPIGLEDDGHVLAEDAVIRIRGKNDAAIALQKASTLTCNDIYLEGEFATALWAASGSLFVGRFKSDVQKLEAHTGASIHVEALDGKLIGPVETASGGVISLPERVVGR